jgi:hypothetical protein
MRRRRSAKQHLWLGPGRYRRGCRNAVTNRDAEPYANSNRYNYSMRAGGKSNTNCVADPKHRRDAHGYADCNSYGDSDSYSDSYSYGDSYSYSYSNSYGDCYPNIDTSSYSDAYCEAHSHTKAAAHAAAKAVRVAGVDS